VEPFIPDELEPFDRALIGVLYETPTKWAPVNWDDSSDTEAKALERLIEAGLIEARVELEARMEGKPKGLYVRARVRGDYRRLLLREAFAKVPEWMTDDGKCRAEVSIEYDITETRLTDKGELTLHNWQSQGESHVLTLVRGLTSHSSSIMEGGKVLIEKVCMDDEEHHMARHESSVKSARSRELGRVEIDFLAPWFQKAPEARAILAMLRKLTDRFQDLPEETTDVDWTAFRALAKAGAVEGIIRFTCTYADADGPSTECFRVRGDYPPAMPSRPFLTSEPSESVLVKVRLTGTGMRWAEYLASENIQPAQKVRGHVLHLLYEAKAVAGMVRCVPIPAASDRQPAVAPCGSAGPDAEDDAVETTAGSDGTTHRASEDDTRSVLYEIKGTLRALLQGGGCDLKPDEARDRLDAMPPSRRKAWGEWLTAERELKGGTDRQAYEWTKARLEPGKKMVAFDTWCRYLRDTRKALGLQRRSPGHPKPTGKSVVSPDDVDPRYYSRNE